MKALWCLTSVILLSTLCSGSIDVEKTVQQVQNILKANSGLPRLNRDEIIQLLNDIRAEDAKSSSASTETSREVISTTPVTNEKDNEIDHKEEPIGDNHLKNNENFILFSTTPGTMTNKGNIMLVLPYTPRDAASLQELYTKPPRVSLVTESEATVSPSNFKNSKSTGLPINNPLDFTEDMQAFLNAHGLDGRPGQDHFLLPLDGFKPLPPAKVVDGNVQLPENILLNYDLISPEPEHIQGSETSKEKIRDNSVYQPWKNKPFELETAASESKEQTYPFDLPKNRPTKSVPSSQKPNYEPIDYESIKVIPLGKGPNPDDDDSASLENDPSKRQTNSTTENVDDAKQEESQSSENKSEAVADAGASISDLEDSFGGAAPAEPGDSMLPPPKKNGFYWMLDWNSFLEVGDGDTKVNIRLEPKLGDPQMFLPVNVP